MKGLRITARGENVLAFLLAALLLVFLGWVAVTAQDQRCDYLVDNHKPVWMIERTCPASYLP